MKKTEKALESDRRLLEGQVTKEDISFTQQRVINAIQQCTSDQHFQKNPFMQKEQLYRSVLGQASNYFLRKFPNECKNVDRLVLTMGNKP